MTMPPATRVVRSLLLQEDHRGRPCSPIAAFPLCSAFGERYRIDGLWNPRRPSAHVIGPTTAFGNSFPGTGLLQVGAYLLPDCASFFLSVRAREIADRVVRLDSLWTQAARIESAIADCERIRAESRFSKKRWSGA